MGGGDPRRDYSVMGSMDDNREISAIREDIASMQKAIDSLRRSLHASQYGGRFRSHMNRLLKRDASVLVASKGDADLIALTTARAAHFPQALDGDYAGAYPADDIAAIAHLEALRDDGYDTLVLPEFSSWWLEHYAGFRSHLESHYTAVTADEIATVFDLRGHARSRPSSPLSAVLDLLRAIGRQLEREPTLLDWCTDLKLQTVCAESAVAASREPSTLPHFDRSVDVVVTTDDGPGRIAEACRVADVAVILIGAKGAVETRWLASPAPPVETFVETRPVASSARDVPLTIPGPNGETLLAWRGDGIALLPGWLGPILSIFERDGSAGAAGGRILDYSGRLHHAGGLLLADGSLVQIGENDWRPGDPRYAFVRKVDFCSSWFMVTTRRAFEAAGGFDESLPAGSYRDADFCLRLGELGYSVYIQPESTAVCNRATTARLRSSPRVVDDRRRARRFAERWKRALRSRPAFLDTWGTSAYSRLPLTHPR
jgi:hypothetical protein